MKIKILLEGKIREKYFIEGVAEFSKRLTPYCTFEILELKEIYFPQNAYVIALEIEGENLSSEQFAQKINEIQNSGVNELCFLIGGAEGLPPEISNQAEFKLSLSKMTFLHQESVFILTEQIYRAFKILKGEPYHK